MGKQGGKERGARGQGLGVGGALLDRWIRGRGDQREGRQAWSRGGPRQSRGSLACKHLFPIMEKPWGFLFELSSFLEGSLPSPLGPEPFTEPDSSCW